MYSFQNSNGDWSSKRIVFRFVTTPSEVYRKTGACATSSQWNRKMTWRPWNDWLKGCCLVWRREDEGLKGSFSSESKGECWGRRTYSGIPRLTLNGEPPRATVSVTWSRTAVQTCSRLSQEMAPCLWGCSKRNFSKPLVGMFKESSSQRELGLYEFSYYF